MTAPVIRVSGEWLALRERADAAARAGELVEHLRRELPAAGPLVIHDLGCGTGGMGRWLAPQLRGPQRWVEHDRDADLLAIAATDLPGPAVDGGAVTVETRVSDITRLQRSDLAGASLITASALLDLLTSNEVNRLVAVCAGAGCPTLLTLSVVGHVTLSPPEPIDHRVAAAFDAHQRRDTDRGRLLGPDAVTLAAQAFRRHGAEVIVRPSPWRLNAGLAALTADWLAGWVAAASEQDPALAAQAGEYARRRQAEVAAGRLEVSVGHADMLAIPRRS